MASAELQACERDESDLATTMNDRWPDTTILVTGGQWEPGSVERFPNNHLRGGGR